MCDGRAQVASVPEIFLSLVTIISSSSAVESLSAASVFTFPFCTARLDLLSMSFTAQHVVLGALFLRMNINRMSFRAASFHYSVWQETLWFQTKILHHIADINASERRQLKSFWRWKFRTGETTSWKSSSRSIQKFNFPFSAKLLNP